MVQNSSRNFITTISNIETTLKRYIYLIVAWKILWINNSHSLFKLIVVITEPSDAKK
jgi:hypothetical protein